MATTITVACDRCGKIEITSDDIGLMVCENAPRSYYTFDCPACHKLIRRDADDCVISLLMSGGVEAVTWLVPAEAIEPHTGPKLNSNDWLDFAKALAASDDLAEVAAAEGAG